MINFKLIKRILVVIIILTTIILCLIFLRNSLAIEIIITISFVLILLLTKKENNFEDYAPFIIVIILGLVTIYQIVTSPQPQIRVDIVRELVNPIEVKGELTSVMKINKFEAMSFTSNTNFSYVQIRNLNVGLNENSTLSNQYYIIITNNGTLPINSLAIYLNTPFDIEDWDIVSSKGITDYKKDEGRISSGNIYLKIDLLDLNESANIIFQNKNIGEIDIYRCLIDNKPISCNVRVHDDFFVLMPKDKKINITTKGVSVNITFPKFSGNGTYHLLDNGTFEYRPFIDIPQGSSASMCYTD